MTRTFDLIVVGSGAAANAVATRCRAAGWTVAMIDQRPFGGTCALRGCEPKKTLVAAAAAVNATRSLAGKGVEPGQARINWPELIRFKRTFTDPYPEQRKADLQRAGIETFQGTARFVGASRLTVRDTVLKAVRAIVIAAGARPADLPIPGKEHLMTSDELLDLSALPSSLAFVGGGYISFEFAHVTARAGARVVIVDRGARPLEQFDGDLVDRLVARTRNLGVDVRLALDVRAVEVIGAQRRVIASGAGGSSQTDADLVVHGAGRVPDIDELDLRVAGVRFSREGIEVNEYLQSVSNPVVYAAGDCAATDGPALTPVASYEGSIVAANLVEGNHVTPDYSAIPSVVFTLPPLARVGFGEEQARANGLRFKVRYEDTSMWLSSRRLGETHSAFKVLIEDGTGRMLGAHLLGPHADETINLFALAMRNGITADRFKQTLWAYPTHGSDTAYMI